jgi:hypothetical protein
MTIRSTRKRARGAAPLILVAGMLALAIPQVAQARTVTAPNVTTASGAQCYVLRYGRGIECMAPYLKDPANPAPELDVYLALRNRGKASFGERGDYPGWVARPVLLHHGDRWRPGRSAKLVTCRNRLSGLWCTNADKHGFRLSKSVTALF